MTINNSLEIKSHWDKIGNKYQNVWHSPAQKIMSKWETDFIKKWITSNEPRKILDLGVGNGRILEAIIDSSSANALIYGLDISFQMVDYCKQKFLGNKKIKEIKMLENNKNFDVYGEKFDFITSIRVIKYNENWKEMLKQICELLNKEGVMLFSMPNKNSITRLRKPNITYIKASLSDIKKIAYENNMKILEIRGFSKIPDFFYKINNSFFSKLIIFSEKLLEFIFGKYFLCREVFYVFKKNK